MERGWEDIHVEMLPLLLDDDARATERGKNEACNLNFRSRYLRWKKDKKELEAKWKI